MEDIGFEIFLLYPYVGKSPSKMKKQVDLKIVITFVGKHDSNLKSIFLTLWLPE